MEGLMSEATDLILSPHRNTIIGPYKVLKWESGNVEMSEVSSGLNSFTLLRLSITNSIKHRHVDVEVPYEKTTKPNKCKRCKEPRVTSPKVDIRLLNSELATFHPEGKTSLNEKGSPIEQNKSDIVTKAFTELLDNKQTSDPEITDNIQSQSETESYKKEETLDNEEQKNRKKIAQNGMKLASRKYSDSIYENCSTYSLACPEVLQERENFTPPMQRLQFHDQPLDESVPEVNDHVCTESSAKQCTSDNKSSADDPVSLIDSFFVKITDEEGVSQSSFYHKDGENAIVKKDNIRIENDYSVPEYYSGGTEAQKRERKHSKKLRKKNKKSKSKDVPTYECPKCGVSYILSTKTSESTARCLHCDFWTSVEPEFLKREKQAWNTCRIC